MASDDNYSSDELHLSCSSSSFEEETEPVLRAAVIAPYMYEPSESESSDTDPCGEQSAADSTNEDFTPLHGKHHHFRSQLHRHLLLFCLIPKSLSRLFGTFLNACPVCSGMFNAMTEMFNTSVYVCSFSGAPVQTVG
ncbi:hypothetical protein BaRGS_00032578 [Batillaria attramentaria]|uniref:Uncharacterized protein n=1 Tax=Batillaria attramentaria TaxID=370345 RepID=A0ABD0JMU4_9CAEN